MGSEQSRVTRLENPIQVGVELRLFLGQEVRRRVGWKGG